MEYTPVDIAATQTDKWHGPFVTPEDQVAVTSPIDDTFQCDLVFSDNSSYSNEPTTLQIVEDIINEKLIVLICALGLLGNVLNLLVLCQKSLVVTMERMERSAHYGLVGLAASDALLCVASLPTGLVGSKVFGFRSYDFRILYTVYSNGVTNTFILFSTWLTVCMAVSRYLVVCYPFHARMFIGKRFAIISLVHVFLASIVFNIPRYYVHAVGSIQCAEGGHYYYKMFGTLSGSPVLHRVYMWLFFIIGIALPFIVLAFCNTKLIVALLRSSRMHGKNQSSSGRTSGDHDSRPENRITLLMILIVGFYIFLVVPAEVMVFLTYAVIENVEYVDLFHLTAAILNMFQATNFALNFLLYCAVNAYFRQTVCRLMRRVGVDCGRGNLTSYDQRMRRGTDNSVCYVSTGKTDVNTTTV